MRSFVSPIYESRRDTLIEVLRSDDIIKMKAKELLELQCALGAGGTWGRWEFPPEFMPDGQLRALAQRSCSFENFFSDAKIDQPKYLQAWTEIIRYGVARSFFPGARKLAKVSTIITEIRMLARLAKTIVELPYSEDVFWSKVSSKELFDIGGKSVFDTLRRFKERGYISDSPREEPQVEGAAGERDRYNEAPHVQKSETAESWLSLPDKFTSECGWRSARVIRLLGPTLLAALEERCELQSRKDRMGGICTLEIIRSQSQRLAMQ